MKIKLLIKEMNYLVVLKVLKYLDRNRRVYWVQIVSFLVNHHPIYSIVLKIINTQSSPTIPAFIQGNHLETLFIIMEKFQTKQ